MTNAIVTIQNGKPMANSRDVAELFGGCTRTFCRASRTSTAVRNFVG
jgi:phage regulator Rha-like protein